MKVSSENDQVVVVAGLICKPNAPTELGVTWKWAEAYAELGKAVVVVTHKSQESYFDGYELPKAIEVVFLGNSRRFSHNPATLLEALGLWLSALNWSFSVRKWVKSQKKLPSLVQHTSISSLRLPTPLIWGESSSVWGPLGGGHLGNIGKLGFKSRLYESVRNLSIYCFGFIAKLLVPKRIKKTLTVLATNSPTFDLLSKVGFQRIYFELSDGISTSKMVMKKSKFEVSPNRPLKIIWAGRLVDSKRPRLAILALSKLHRKGINAELTFFGSGDRAKLVSYSKELRLEEKVKFAEAIEWEDLMKKLQDFDVTLFTSGRDSSSPFLLESLYTGLRCIAIRTQVVEGIFPESLVPGPRDVEKSDQDLAEKLAEEVEKWFNLPNEVKVELIQDAMEFARSHAWLKKAERVLTFSQGND